MDAARRLALAAVAAVVVTAPAAAAAPDPNVLQARYDAAREFEERELRSARPNPAELRRARAEIAWAERHDSRPAGWRAARDVPPLRLPATWTRHRPARSTDTALAAELAALGRGYRGWSAFWVHDLATGAAAGWNSDARFPAASTVKLGVLAAALRRFGPRPERSQVWYDLRQITGWSSNLAANRVVRKLGGERAVGTALRRLGATSSTYPGPYRAGTATAADAPKPPPLATWRVTTARDLSRALYTLNGAAAGNLWLQRRSGLGERRARLALALLLSSSRSGMNAGLVRPFVPGARIAQKSGWTSDFRATAAILYLASGPKIVVVLAYRPGITTAEARTLGRRVVRRL